MGSFCRLRFLLLQCQTCIIKLKTKGADIMDEMKAISDSDNEVIADLRRIV